MPSAVPRREELAISEQRPRKGVLVISVSGESDLYGAESLRDHLFAAADSSSVVIVDLSETTFVDSMTLGVLLGALKRHRSLGVTLRLVAADGPVRRVLELTMLDRIFAIDGTQADALAATEAG